MATITEVSSLTGVPVGAVCRYVLARWASGGAEGLMELGPSTVERLWSVLEEAEAEGTPAARLEAYDKLRQMVSWLRAGLD
jgi:hypothetical protein